MNRFKKFIDDLDLSASSVLLLGMLVWTLVFLPELFPTWCATVMGYALIDLIFLRKRVALWKEAYERTSEQWDELYAFVDSRKEKPSD